RNMAKTITVGEILADLGIATNPGFIGLYGSRATGATDNVLTWTYPDNMLTALISGTLNFFHLTLQWSTARSDTPTGDVAYAVTGTFPVPSNGWHDLQQWTPTTWNAEGNPTTYTHPWPTNQPICYRLILNCEHIAQRIEFDWNTTLIVPP